MTDRYKLVLIPHDKAVSSGWIEVGKFATMDEVHKRVYKLDSDFLVWERCGFGPLGPENYLLTVYEGCELEVEDLLTGEVTSLTELTDGQ